MGICRIDQPSKSNYGYYVRIRWRGVIYAKFFSDKKNGGADKAWEAAEAYFNELDAKGYFLKDKDGKTFEDLLAIEDEKNRDKPAFRAACSRILDILAPYKVSLETKDVPDMRLGM